MASVEGNEVILFITDLEGIIIGVDSRSCDLLHADPSEIIGKRCSDLIHPAQAELESCPLKGSGGRDRGDHFILLDGKLMEEISFPITGREGANEVVHYLSNTSFADFNGNLYRLAEASRKVSELLRDLNDDIFSEFLNLDLIMEKPEERRDAGRLLDLLEELRASVERSAGAIKRFGEAWQIGNMILSRADTDPTKVVDEALSMVRHIAAARGIEICRDTEGPIPLLAIEPRLMRMAVAGIILNSIEALSGRRDGRITLSIIRTRLEVIIRIRDNGPGMSVEEIDKVILSPFSAENGENGRGLRAAALIVHLHGGHISISSIPDSGTLVTISLIME